MTGEAAPPDVGRHPPSTSPPPAYPASLPGSYYQPPGPPVPPSTNGFAIAALVLGILGGWILALIFGYIGKGQIDRSGGTQQGRGLAIAGIVLGWIGLAFTILAVIVILIFAVAIHGHADRSPSSRPHPTSNVTAVTEAQLATLATSVGHPIFWVGPRTGMTYELTQTSNGNIAIRYLPAGVTLGSTSPYLTVATYPFSGAYPALRAAGAKQGTTPLRLRHGGLAVVSPTQPDNVHAAFPNVDYQAEVFDPTAGAAEKLVADGKLASIGNLNASSATPPTATTAANLRSLAKSLGHPIYWAGPKPKDTLELTQTSAGQIYVRYLPKGVPVGTGKAYLTVATYPFQGAFTALRALTRQQGAVGMTLSGGGLGLIDSTDPKSIHVAFPNVDYQIEVFDPSPAVVRAVVSSGQLTSVR